PLPRARPRGTGHPVRPPFPPCPVGCVLRAQRPAPLAREPRAPRPRGLRYLPRLQRNRRECRGAPGRSTPAGGRGRSTPRRTRRARRRPRLRLLEIPPGRAEPRTGTPPCQPADG